MSHQLLGHTQWVSELNFKLKTILWTRSADLFERSGSKEQIIHCNQGELRYVSILITPISMFIIQSYRMTQMKNCFCDNFATLTFKNMQHNYNWGVGGSKKQNFFSLQISLSVIQGRMLYKSNWRWTNDERMYLDELFRWLSKNCSVNIETLNMLLSVIVLSWHSICRVLILEDTLGTRDHPLDHIVSLGDISKLGLVISLSQGPSFIMSA